MESRRFDPNLVARAEYGGFWIRVLATLIDAGVLFIPVALLEAFIVNPSAAANGFRIQQALVTYGVWAAYCVPFWSSSWHATLGKRICGLTILSFNGEQLTFGRAMARYLSAMVSGLVIIGPLFVIGTERRQGLHDLLAGTIVVKRSALASRSNNSLDGDACKATRASS